MACIGEHFTEGEDICGVVVNIRGKQDRLSIWTRTSSDESIQVYTPESLFMTYFNACLSAASYAIS